MKQTTAVSGYTTPELIVTLSLVGILLSLSVPSIARSVDVLSVHAAREAVVSAAAQARVLAISRGGAFLRISEAGVVEVVGRDTVQLARHWDLADRYGVALEIENSPRTDALLEYDALGVGRMANLTLRVRRRGAQGAITFSAYGRPRTW
jgi:type II secretory pathway pseudopilin PulG